MDSQWIQLKEKIASSQLNKTNSQWIQLKDKIEKRGH